MSVRRTLYLLRKQQSKYIIKQHSSDHQASATAIHTQGESVARLGLQRWSWSKEIHLFRGEKQAEGTLPSLSEKGKWLLGLAHQSEPLEKEMATHSSILAWRIPCTEEPGGLQSRGSQRVRHNWTKHTHTPEWKETTCILVVYRLVNPHWDTTRIKFRPAICSEARKTAENLTSESESHSVMSDSLQPHRLLSAKLLCPWGFSRQEYWSG